MRTILLFCSVMALLSVPVVSSRSVLVASEAADGVESIDVAKGTELCWG